MRRSPRLASKRAADERAAADGGGGGGADVPPTRRPGATKESSSASSSYSSPSSSGPDQSPGRARYYRSLTPQKRSRHSGGALGERALCPRDASDSASADGRADSRGAPAAAPPDCGTPLLAEEREAPVPEDSPCPQRPRSTAPLPSSSSAAGPPAVHAPEDMPVGLIQITPRRPVPDVAARILSKSPSARSERRVSLAEKVMTRNTVLNIKNFVEAPEKSMPPPNKPEEPTRVVERSLVEREREPASATADNGDDADTELRKLNVFERIDQENDPNNVARKERRQSRVTFAKMAHVRFFNKNASPSPRGPRLSSKIGLQSPGRSPGRSPSLSYLRDNKGACFEMPDLGSTGSALDNPFDLRLSLEGSQEGNESESDMNDVSMELSSCDGGIRTPVLNPRPLSSIEGELESPQMDDVMDETRPFGGIRAISDPLVQDGTDNISGLIDFGRPTVQSPSNVGRGSISTRFPPPPNLATAPNNGRRDSLAYRFSQGDYDATDRLSLGDCEAMDETICIGGIRPSSIGCGGARRLSSTVDEATEEFRSEGGNRRSSVGRGAAHRLSLASTAAIGETRCVEGTRRSSVGADAAADETFSSTFEGDDVFSPQAPRRSSVASSVLDREVGFSQLPSSTPSINLDPDDQSSQLPSCPPPVDLDHEDRSSRLSSHTPSVGLEHEGRSSQLPSCTPSVGLNHEGQSSLLPSCTLSISLHHEDQPSQQPSCTLSVGLHLEDQLSLVPSCTPAVDLDHEDESFQLSSHTSSIGVVASPMAEQFGLRQKESRSSTAADRRMSTGTVRRRERAIPPAEMRRHTLAGGGHSSLASGTPSHARDEMHTAAQDASLIAASTSAVVTCELELLKLDEVLVKGLDEHIDHETKERDNGARDLCDGEIKGSNASTASALNEVFQNEDRQNEGIQNEGRQNEGIQNEGRQNEGIQNEDNPKDLTEQNDVGFDALANKMEVRQDNRTESLSNTSAEASRARAVNASARAELEALKQDEVWLMNLDAHTDLVYKSFKITTNEGRAEISNQDKRSKDMSDRSAKASHARKENMSQIKEFRGKIERLKQERAELEVMKQKLEVNLAEKRELEEAARIARAKQDEEALALRREREAVERAYNEKRESLVHLAEVDLCGDDVLGTWKLMWLDGLVMSLECRGRVRAHVDLSEDQRTMLVKAVNQSDCIAAWVTNGEACCDLGEKAGENGVKLDRAVEVLRRVGGRLQAAEKVESDVRRVCRRHQAEVRVCGDALVSEICFVGMVIEAKLLLQLWLSPEGCWGYDQKLCYGHINLYDLTKVLHGCGTPGVLTVAEAVNKWWEEIDRLFPH